jgi:hypothetical protein
MIRDFLKCPRCGEQLQNNAPVDKPFACVACGTFVRVKVRYGGLLLGLSLLLSSAVAFALKWRGLSLVVASGVSWLPVYFLAQVFANIVAPPGVEFSRPEDLLLHLDDPKKPHEL